MNSGEEKDRKKNQVSKQKIQHPFQAGLKPTGNGTSFARRTFLAVGRRF